MGNANAPNHNHNQRLWGDKTSQQSTMAFETEYYSTLAKRHTGGGEAAEFYHEDRVESRLDCFVTVSLAPDGTTCIGYEENYHRCSPEQFMLGDYHEVF